MKKYIPHSLALAIFLSVFIYGQLFIVADMSYWTFLTYKYVLNIGVAGLGIIIGYVIKNYYVVVIGTTFTLATYCLAFLFETQGFIAPFLFAMYTVFLGFATLANLARHFKDWVLAKDGFS